MKRQNGCPVFQVSVVIGMKSIEVLRYSTFYHHWPDVYVSTLANFQALAVSTCLFPMYLNEKCKRKSCQSLVWFVYAGPTLLMFSRLMDFSLFVCDMGLSAAVCWFSFLAVGKHSHRGTYYLGVFWLLN